MMSWITLGVVCWIVLAFILGIIVGKRLRSLSEP